jgi:hypothetical protein
MTRPKHATGDQETSLAERLAGIPIAQIDAMSDHELADLMGASAEQIGVELARGVKAATDESAERLIAAVETGRAVVISDPVEMRRRLGCRPPVGDAAGEGPSIQVRACVTTRTRTALEAIAAAQGRRLSPRGRVIDRRRIPCKSLLHGAGARAQADLPRSDPPPKPLGP